MRYLCLTCEERFDHEGTESLRCPKCLRTTGLEPIATAAEKSARATQSPYLVPGLAAVALTGALGLYAAWRGRAPSQVGETIPMAPLELSAIEAHVRRLHADAGDLAGLFDANDAIQGFATRATEGRDDRFAMAEGVTEALRAKASERAFIRWSLGVPRDEAPRTAAQTYEAIREARAEVRAYPLEIAALAASALRARGVPALVVEIERFPGDQAPPDPSGQLGYYGVAVYEGEGTDGTPRIFDPWGGHATQPEVGDYRVLTDVEAVGAALNLRALHLLVREHSAERALEVSTAATRLCPRAANARTVRGAILQAAGNPTEALAEMEAARQLESDGPRRNLVAALFIAQGRTEEAERELSAALEEFPQFAHAHANLAAIHLGNGDFDQARAELDLAAQHDPDLHILPAMRANLYAAQGDLPRAATEIERAIERNPTDFGTRIAAAEIFRQAARYADVRTQARAALELVPESARANLRELLVRRFGESTFEDEPEVTPEELEAVSGDDDLTLRLPGVEAPPEADDDGLSLEGEDDSAAGSTTLRLGNPGRFTLGGSGSLSLD